jgi:hypothetical protein
MKMISTLLLTALTLPLAHAMPSTTKVLSIKEWATDDTKVIFHVIPSKKLAFDTPQEKIARVDTITKAQQGTTTTPNTYTADSNFSFYNFTSEPQTVKFMLDVCIDQDNDSPGNGPFFHAHCGHYAESVSVAANTLYTKHYAPELIVNFPTAGVYHINAYANYYTDYWKKRFGSSSRSKITITA